MRTRSRFALGVLAVVAASGAMACGATAQTTSATVGAFPMPGTQSASPETQISLRGAPAAQLGSVTVSGSESGNHTGTLRPHSDGNGASFVLDAPLRGGETVSVKTDLAIPGARNGDYSFKTVSRPRKGLGSGSGAPDLQLLQELTGQVGTPPKGSVPRYRSRPDLRPPAIQCPQPPSGTDARPRLRRPKKVFGAKPRPGRAEGPMLVDDAGAPAGSAGPRRGHVDRLPRPAVSTAARADLVAGPRGLGTARASGMIFDTAYQPGPDETGSGNGYQLDIHEYKLTGRGTLLMLIYSRGVPATCGRRR